MKIARVELDNGLITWVFKEGDEFIRLEGNILGDYHVTDERVRVRRYLPPVEPPNIIAMGLNYSSHVRETGIESSKEPQFFLKATSSIVGEGDFIVIPSEAPDEVDYEAELGIVIKKNAKRIKEKDAGDYILGYVCANDVSARDCQFGRDIQWARAKSFDSFCPFGPFIETEIDPLDLQIKCEINGEVMQDSRTSDMINNPYELVSFLSRQMTLLPGTLILTGTPEGVGFKREPKRFLREGDTVRVIIEGIGVLTNKVKRETI